MNPTSNKVQQVQALPPLPEQKIFNWSATSPCSLDECPAGDCMAKLPALRDEPLPVTVDEWKPLFGKGPVYKTVCLRQGMKKGKTMNDAALKDAEFYPGKVQCDMSDDNNQSTN